MIRQRLVRIALFLAAPVLAILLAIVVAAAVLAASGEDPVRILRATAAYGSKPASLVASSTRA